jgi:segregation and condensation protein B
LINESAKLVGILFYSGEALSAAQLQKSLELDSRGLKELVESTNKKLEPLGLFIIENEGELQLIIKSELAGLIEEFYSVSPQNLSQASLEVLSIIAYKQPISKSQIEEIRGVSSDQSIKNLINKDLIRKINGKVEPKYATTTEFLKITGLKSLKELESSEETDMFSDGR